MSVIQELFGKASDIRRSDIERVFVENCLEESSTLDYKCLGTGPEHTVKKLTEELKESIIVKPIVSFLNGRAVRSALLVLGVSAPSSTPAAIRPISRELLNSEKVRQVITEQIGSTPSPTAFPQFRIIEVDCRDKGCVFLIELLSWEQTLYYSRITDVAYGRRGDSTYRFPLSEAISLAESHRTSISLLELAVEHPNTSKLVMLPNQNESTGMGGEVESPQRLTLNIISHNKGTIPAIDVMTTILIPIQVGLLDAKHEGIGISDISYLNNDKFRVYQCQSNGIRALPVYPGMKVIMGKLHLTIESNCAVVINSKVCDWNGISEQQFMVLVNNDTVFNQSQSHRRWE